MSKVPFWAEVAIDLLPSEAGGRQTSLNIIHDCSEFLGLKPSEVGWFSYPALPL